MRRFLAFALVLAACSGRDSSRSTTTGATTSVASSRQRGADALILRVPRAGGTAHVTTYPNTDSVVWTASDDAPALDRVLAFDPDAGLIAAADARGLPLWFDLRTGHVITTGRGKNRGLVSVDGSTIYGVGADGAIARFTPSGNWVFTPPRPARAVFPQTSGTVLVFGGQGDSAKVWRMHPPNTRLSDTVATPGAGVGTGSPLGDQIYLSVASTSLVGLNARTLAKSRAIDFDHAIRGTAATPSGDRFYVITDSSNDLSVVDQYQGRIATRTTLPGQPRDLRVDPFGRYVLVRPVRGDSLWIVAIGTDKVVGAIHSTWRADLPFVAPDGLVATVSGNDVVFVDPLTLKETRRVSDGASDFWYPFIWLGFRPRNPELDQPVEFNRDSDTTTAVVPVAGDSGAARPTSPADSVRPTTGGYTVSFAALLDEGKARDRAAKIVVNGQTARVVTTMTAGTAIYRVVLGPFTTRDEADQVGRVSGLSYIVYPGAL